MATYVLGAIGNYFLPGIGGIIGAAIGSMIDYKSPPDQTGPRLTDLKVTSSAYGQPIPILYGTSRISGNVIWSTDIIETKHTEEVGGKGGGGQKVNTFTYSISMAIGLCEGSIVGVRRIWANGKLIYSASANADAATIMASNSSIKGIRVYTGAEDQQPDPLIQSDKGVGATPAFRGLAYLVLDNFQLADFGNSVPNIECEVVQSGSVSSSVVALASKYNPGFPTVDLYNSFHTILGCEGGVTRVGIIKGDITSPAYVIDRSLNYLGPDTRDGWSEYIFPMRVYDTAGVPWYFVKTILHANNQYFLFFGVKGGNYKYVLTTGSPPASGWVADITENVPSGATCVGIGCNPSGSMIFAFYRYSDIPGDHATGWVSLKFYGVGFPMTVVSQGTIDTSTGSTGIKIGQVNLTGSWGSHGIIEEDGNRVWISGAVCTFGSDGVLRKAYDPPTANPGTLYGAWFAQDGVAVFIPNSYPSWGGDSIWIYGCSPVVNTGTIQLSTAVADLCHRAGLSDTDIDVSELASDIIDGYVISNHTNARGAIEPLMKVYFFEAIETGGKVKFVKRGNNPVANIPYDDVAAHDNAINELPDDVKIVRGSDIEVPAEINVSYWDKATDYQTGTQYSRRTTVYHENVQQENLAMVLTADRAAQVSEVLLYDAWVSRNSFDIETGQKWAYLDPCDVVIVNRNGISATARIVKIDAGGNGIVKMSLVMEDSLIYNSSATGISGTSSQGNNIALPGPTKAIYLDIPALRDKDAGTTPSFYIAANGMMSDWKGSSIFESTDGSTYAFSGLSLEKSCVIGMTTTTLGNFSSGFIVDEINSVTVNVINGTLSSCTYADMMNGYNRAVVGSEIIGFRTATLVSSGVYVLTGLIRGLLGTEWAMTTHTSADTFVLLDPSRLSIMTDQIGDIDTRRFFKAVSYGQTLSGATGKAFTNTAANLKPLSVAQLSGNKQASGQFNFSWVRRTRLGGDWKNGADVPLGEAYEKYYVEICDSNWNAKDSFYTFTPSATYTVAQQTAIFGAAQTNLYVRVSQVSDVVGNGFPAQKML